VIIVWQLIGLAVLLTSAIVPLWAVRPILGVIVRLMLERRTQGEQALPSDTTAPSPPVHVPPTGAPALFG
jgi:hypothetical protein